MISKLLTSWSGGSRISNKRHNSGNCSQPPDHQIFWWVFFKKVIGGEHEKITNCVYGDGTTAFASKTSNECIECETTAYQGIDHAINECVRCDAATQFFDKITKKCISKTSLNRLDATAMKACYGCPNNELFKECAILFSKSENARRASANYDEIVRDCYIKE